MNITMHPGDTSPATFTGTITWCNNQTCGDHAFDDNTGDVQYHDAVPKVLACGAQYQAYRAAFDGGNDHVVMASTLMHAPADLGTKNELQSLSRMTATDGDTSLIAEVAADTWVIGPFTLESLAMSLACQGGCCAGLAVGSAAFVSGDFRITTSTVVRFTDSTGLEYVKFTMHEQTSFLALDAELTYDTFSDDDADAGYVLTGAGSVVLTLPIGTDGMPLGSGGANGTVAGADMFVKYTQPAQGNASFFLNGTTTIAGVSVDMEFSRDMNEPECWNGTLTSSSGTISIQCGAISASVPIHVQASTPLFDIKLDAMLCVLCLPLCV